MWTYWKYESNHTVIDPYKYTNLHWHTNLANHTKVYPVHFNNNLNYYILHAFKLSTDTVRRNVIISRQWNESFMDRYAVTWFDPKSIKKFKIQLIVSLWLTVTFYIPGELIFIVRTLDVLKRTFTVQITITVALIQVIQVTNDLSRKLTVTQNVIRRKTLEIFLLL